MNFKKDWQHLFYLILAPGEVLLDHKRVSVGCQLSITRERERERNDPDDEKHVLKLRALCAQLLLFEVASTRPAPLNAKKVQKQNSPLKCYLIIEVNPWQRFSRI